MRQGQQNRRGRGRHNGGGGGGHSNYSGGGGNNNNNNNNRKGQNPLARSYESNGPDVKIRGNPAHIAEKYMTLARDAQSVGDSVLAESYLQHAEHYNRIIMAFREQQGETPYRPRTPMDGEGGSDQGTDEFGDNSGGGEGAIRGQEPQPGMFDPAPQRFGDRPNDQQQQGREGNRDDRQNRGYDDRNQQRRPDGNRDNNNRDNNNRDNNRDGQRRDRYDGGNRGYNSNRDDRGERGDRPERIDRRDRYDRNRQPQQGGNQNSNPPHERAPGDPPYQERYAAERPAEVPVEQPRIEMAPAAIIEPPPMMEAPIAVQPKPAEIEHVPAAERVAPAPRRRAAAAAPAADRFADATQEQPEFLRRPVRRRREVPAATEAAEQPPVEETVIKPTE